jgi:protoheme ferro-lyase
VIDEFAADGRTSLVIPPIAFVSDHIGTLYWTDILFRNHAAQAGITAYLRVHRFNDLP